jgi:photosystem II stability/assembly factor-like uncharacterized protein
MASENVYDQSNGAIFVQTGGPGTELKFLGCYDGEDISAPQGDITLELCRRPDGSGGFDVVASGKAPPDLVTTSLTGLSGKTRDYLMRTNCPFNLFYLRRFCGRADSPVNFDSALVLQNAQITQRTYSNVVHHKESEIATHGVDISAWPPLIEVGPTKVTRISTTETLASNDVWTDAAGLCASDCGSQSDPGAVTVLVCDGGAGAAKVYISTNGTTFTACAASPFAVGKHVVSVTRFQVSKSTYRILVGMEAPAGAQGMVAYSDDNGANWTTVNVGGAAAGYGPKLAHSIVSRGPSFIVMAGNAGIIHKSTDGGITWTVKESGVISANAYNCLSFADDKNGWAANGTGGVVAVTHDGGETWSATTPVTGAPALNAIWAWDGMNAMVGTATGLVFRTTDGGVTWTAVTNFTGSGVGAVKSLSFVDGLVGFMVRNTAAPVGSVLRTIDGGANWQVLDAVTNSGYNAVAHYGWNGAWVVGEANAATSMFVKVYEE